MLPLIILFAKAPVPGSVKTRLFPFVDPVSAAELHRAFVQDMIESLSVLSDAADLELSTDVETVAWRDVPVVRSLQGDGDLGMRIYRALLKGLAAGRPRAIVVGSDAPNLPEDHVKGLLRSDADVALGPTEDGGYYAIACRRVAPAMFDGVRWSTSNTLADTMHAIRNCGFTVELGLPWFDVDQNSDLERLRRLPNLPRHTANWFQSSGTRFSRG